MHTLPKWLAPFAHIVAEAWHEEDGFGPRGSYWVILKPGLVNTATETHCVHETSQRDVVQQLRKDIAPCTAENCAVCR